MNARAESTPYRTLFRRAWRNGEYRTAIVGISLMNLTFALLWEISALLGGLLILLAVVFVTPYVWVEIGSFESSRRIALLILALLSALLIVGFGAVSLIAGALAFLLVALGFSAGWIIGWVRGYGTVEENQEGNEKGETEQTQGTV